MPDLPDDTIVLNVPIDGESLPQYVIIRFTQARHNFKPRTNQEVLNLLRSIFGSGYWEVIERAGLVWLAASRGAVYNGADVEDLPIHAEEKKRIVAAL